jgi:hypothetical protein
MERGFTSQAAPTAAEQKWGGGAGAEATMNERQISPAGLAQKKSNTGMMIGIAAVVVIALGVGGFMLLKNKQTVVPAVPVSSTSVTATAPTSTAPIPAGQGVLLLSASPYGELEKIVDDKGNSVNLTEENRYTPTRIELDPGKYQVTVAGPNGSKQIVPVDIEAGKQNRKAVKLGNVNFDDLEKEVTKQ